MVQTGDGDRNHEELAAEFKASPMQRKMRLFSPVCGRNLFYPLKLCNTNVRGFSPVSMGKCGLSQFSNVSQLHLCPKGNLTNQMQFSEQHTLSCLLAAGWTAGLLDANRYANGMYKANRACKSPSWERQTPVSLCQKTCALGNKIVL